MNEKKIDIKYFYIAIVICLLLGGCLFFALRDNAKNASVNNVIPDNKIDNETVSSGADDEEISEESLDIDYELMFNVFAGIIDMMGSYPTQNIVSKSELSQDIEFIIAQCLLTQDDYTDSEEMADFNDEIAKYRTIKQSVLKKIVKDYFNEDFNLPKSFTIFPYNYQLVGDNYVGEAFIGGVEGFPSWNYEVDTYKATKTKLSIIGYAYFEDFGQICVDEPCNNVLEGADYRNVLNYKDSLTKITVNFDRYGDAFRFANITKGE